ncbi:MAG: hypothetical protein HQ478_13425 [Chloroflexi bacterium]|nr:hypothetical protein [Chloroflexota bacterium]
MPVSFDTPFPTRPFLSCGPDELVIVDQSDMGAMLKGGDLTPWARFIVGPQNILESAPLQALVTSNSVVSVECTDCTIVIDFGQETARRTAGGRNFAYMSDVSEANDGRGWMAVS